MKFTAPVKEQKFVLETIARLGEIASSPRFSAATPDLVDAVLDGAAAFAEAEYAPLDRLGDDVGARWEQGRVSLPDGYKAAYQAYVENGWGTLSADPEAGGQGLPFCLATAVLEDLGGANLGFTLVNMLTLSAVEALSAYGNDAQRSRWLPRLVSGEWNGTMNLTEPQAGSDVGALRTSASPAGDGLWQIKGQKIFITFGEHDLTDNIVHFVLARIAGAPSGTKGLSLFLVPKYRLDTEGRPGVCNDVACVSIEHKLGIHVSPTCMMSFGDHDDCLGELVGAEGGGIRAMFTMMNNARIGVGGQGVQVAERATQRAFAFAKERVQSASANGRSSGAPVPIIDHPDVRRMLMRMRALTQAGRALLYYGAAQVDRVTLGADTARARLDLLVPLIKAHCTDMGCEVASLGIQVHGGIGYVEEIGAAQHFRDARITPIYEGTNGIQAADLVERKLVRDDGSALRALMQDMRADIDDVPELSALAAEVEATTRWMLDCQDVDDRLAGSYPFLTMMATLTAGWLMHRQAGVARTMLSRGQGDPAFLVSKAETAAFYIGQIVPAATGLAASSRAGMGALRCLDESDAIRRGCAA